MIVQISDLHVDADDATGANVARLAACVAAIGRLVPLPAALLATGDLTEHGWPQEYATLRQVLAPLSMPVHVIPGNHDDRTALLAAFEPRREAGPFSTDASVVFATPSLRVIALDTLVPGQAGGDLDEGQLAWLDRVLGASADPTVLALHHPPCNTGIRYMDAMRLAPVASERLGALLRNHPNVVRVVCGHVHRPLFLAWQGTIVSVAPSVAPLGRLDLAPGGTDIASDEPPAFQLHTWQDGVLVSHTVSVPMSARE